MIDRLEVVDGELIVTDYKTGRPPREGATNARHCTGYTSTPGSVKPCLANDRQRSSCSTSRRPSRLSPPLPNRAPAAFRCGPARCGPRSKQHVNATIFDRSRGRCVRGASTSRIAPSSEATQRQRASCSLRCPPMSLAPGCTRLSTSRFEHRCPQQTSPHGGDGNYTLPLMDVLNQLVETFAPGLKQSDRAPSPKALAVWRRVDKFDTAVSRVIDRRRTPKSDRFFSALSSAADHSLLWFTAGTVRRGHISTPPRVPVGSVRATDPAIGFR
ncbi:MAG: hypothetical protein H6512_02100 [Acidimicrobiia bacterium]|nr:hypothetical protein [Acidimicrobiia bacterium]